jgi:hypothetical protein
MRYMATEASSEYNFAQMDWVHLREALRVFHTAARSKA